MKRIVVGVDGSEGARRALAWAVDEAERWDATLVVVNAWSMPVMAAPTGLAPMPVLPESGELEGSAGALLDEVVRAAVGDRPVRVERAVVEGSAAQVLLDAAAGADLLVVGSRGHGGFLGLLLGSVSQHCTHHAACPIVVVPPPHGRS